MEMFYHQNVLVVQTEACRALANLLREHKERPVLLLLSGGSAFDLLKATLSDCIGTHTTIAVLDERFSEDQTTNNFALVEKTDFFQRAQEAGAQSIDSMIRVGDDVESLAIRFEVALRAWRSENPEGVILITQGIGPDGHTAGIMPFPENEKLFEKLFFDDSRWVCGYDAGTKNQYPLRVTTTISFLLSVDYSIVYCVGKNKKEALSRVLADQGNLVATPARIIREMKNAALFTDIVLD